MTVHTCHRQTKKTHRSSRRRSTSHGAITRTKAAKILASTLIEFKQIAEQLQSNVAAIDNEDLRFTVAMIIEALSDEDDIGSIKVEPATEQSFKFSHIMLDDEIAAALSEHHGNCVDEAIAWLLQWLATHPVPITWLGWAFGRVDLAGEKGCKMRVAVDHVVYDFHLRKTIGVTLNDEDNLYRSTLILMNSI